MKKKKKKRKKRKKEFICPPFSSLRLSLAVCFGHRYLLFSLSYFVLRVALTQGATTTCSKRTVHWACGVMGAHQASFHGIRRAH